MVHVHIGLGRLTTGFLLDRLAQLPSVVIVRRRCEAWRDAPPSCIVAGLVRWPVVSSWPPAAGCGRLPRRCIYYAGLPEALEALQESRPASFSVCVGAAGFLEVHAAVRRRYPTTPVVALENSQVPPADRHCFPAVVDRICTRQSWRSVPGTEVTLEVTTATEPHPGQLVMASEAPRFLPAADPCVRYVGAARLREEALLKVHLLNLPHLLISLLSPTEHVDVRSVLRTPGAAAAVMRFVRVTCVYLNRVHRVPLGVAFRAATGYMRRLREVELDFRSRIGRRLDEKYAQFISPIRLYFAQDHHAPVRVPEVHEPGGAV